MLREARERLTAALGKIHGPLAAQAVEHAAKPIQNLRLVVDEQYTRHDSVPLSILRDGDGVVESLANRVDLGNTATNAAWTAGSKCLPASASRILSASRSLDGAR